MDPAAALTIRPWPDTVVDKVGHDARSRYVEQFWLGVLGPSTTWFLRLVAHHLDREPEGFRLDLRATAAALGLGPPDGRNSPLHRAVERTVRFGLARAVGQESLDVRRRLPPLNRHQLRRLPPEVQRAHAEWQEQVLVHERFEEGRRRARRLALSLFEAADQERRREEQEVVEGGG
jgi:hypothetical protein